MHDVTALMTMQAELTLGLIHSMLFFFLQFMINLYDKEKNVPTSSTALLLQSIFKLIL
jgi:hypothetical protein